MDLNSNYGLGTSKIHRYVIVMNHQDDMDEMFDKLEDLTDHQRTSIKYRYRFLMNEYRRRAFQYSIIFYILRTTMTVGSLAVPALLSIQANTSNLYWFTWALSLAVTTANGITTLFKVETRYLTLHTTMENLRTETWQYLELAGRYSGHHGHVVTPTHKNQYVYYCSRIEKIRMKQVGEEFVKHSDTETQHGPQGHGQGQIQGSTVLSPADQALTKTRRDSQHTTGDDSIIEFVEPNKKSTSVSVQDSRGPVFSSSEGKIPVLPGSPKM